MASLLYTFYRSEVESRCIKYSHSEETERVIWEVANALTTPTYRFGLLLTGDCGTGKTTMMKAIRSCIHYLWEKQMRLFHPKFKTSIPLLSAKDIIEEILKEGKTYNTSDILMIDDLGHEPTEIVVYGRILTPIIDLLEHRYERRKYTVISTNLSPEEIRPKYSNRIADRFNEMFHIVEYSGISHRE